ncbi:MAG: NAD(P)H-hydrate dehydratase [Clostridia bacterium]|nr:NAD(P)H-hydrate dehydratase [Clostridia bacterium]
MKTITLNAVERLIPEIKDDHHKGKGGTALMLCGSYGLAGAAALAANGAYRVGVGIVRCVVPESIYSIVSTLVPEAVFSFCREYDGKRQDDIGEILTLGEKSNAMLIGCGLGNNNYTAETVKNILQRVEIPIVLDADGLNVLSGGIEYLRRYKGEKIITPHPAEAARLLGVDTAAIQSDREKYARMLADATGAVTLLKGHDTIIALPYSELYLCPFGNGGMGKGGSGDILAGMITGFLCQGLAPLESAILGVSIHALAGDDAAERLSKNAMMPRDILDSIPAVFKKYSQV